MKHTVWYLILVLDRWHIARQGKIYAGAWWVERDFSAVCEVGRETCKIELDEVRKRLGI